MHPAVITRNLAQVAAAEATELLNHLAEAGVVLRIEVVPVFEPMIRVVVHDLTADLTKRISGLLRLVEARVTVVDGGPLPPGYEPPAFTPRRRTGKVPRPRFNS
jgi:hypothetical protein